MILKYLIQKELLQLRRDSFLPKMIVVYPIVIMLVMPWVMNLEVQNVSIDVVDNDHSTTSRRMVQSVESSHYFVFNGMRSSYAEALTDVERGKADIVMVIPPRYERDKVPISPLSCNKMPQHGKTPTQPRLPQWACLLLSSRLLPSPPCTSTTRI